MMSFLNLVENFSKSEEDIVNIMDRANQYITAPLQDVINDFVMEARLYGNLTESFDKLCKRLEGTKLSDVFWSLKICSEHDANYTEVLYDAKISVKEYLKSKTIQKAIRNSARIDMAALVAAEWLIIRIMDSFLTQKVGTILFSSYIGIGIVAYCVVIFILAVYVLFWR